MRVVDANLQHGGRAVIRFLLCRLLPLFFSGLAFGTVHATDAESQAQQAKVSAAYLYHFLQLVKWPNEDSGSGETGFMVCLYGKDPFGEIIDTVARKKARGKEITVRRLAELHSAERCHLLYVGAVPASHLGEVLRAVDAAGVLTVSDSKDFVARGGMIGFVAVPDESEGGFRVRFEINLDAARKRGLKINSKLLELAIHVRQ